MTVEQGIQELFDRVLTLEAKCMAQNSLIGLLVTTVAAMPGGIGVSKMNENIELSRTGFAHLPNEETVGVKKIMSVMNDLYDKMIINYSEANRKLRFEIIDGGRDS